MANTVPESLKAAASAVNASLAKLQAAVEVATTERAGAAAAREKVQAELTAGWQANHAKLEASLAEARAKIAFLEEDNKQLNNDLRILREEHKELQETASFTLNRLDASVNQLDRMLEHSA